MQKVLLFNQFFSPNFETKNPIYAMMPINLLNLASYLKPRGIEARIYELGLFYDMEPIFDKSGSPRFGVSDEEIIKIIETENPSVIGLGCMYSRHYADIIRLSRIVRDCNRDIKIVMGGNHASSYPEMVLRTSEVDYVVRGEGEETFFELLQALSEATSSPWRLEKIRGLAFMGETGAIIITPPRPIVRNLDELPPIDYSQVDVQRYAGLMMKSPYLMRYPAIGIVTSRGCPASCGFCTIRAVWGRTWRGRSVGAVVDEMALLKQRYGINEFAILDDSVSVGKERWHKICDEIVTRKLDIRWTTPNGIAHWTLDKGILYKMKQAGCYRITFGIESANKETRKFIRKEHSLDQAKELVQYANRIGMWTICTNIVGFPYETRQQIRDTVEFAKDCGTDFATFYMLAPHGNTDLYQYFKKEGLMDFDDILTGRRFDEAEYEKMNVIISEGGVGTKYLSAVEVKDLQMRAYKEFLLCRAISYLNPMRIIVKVRSWEDLCYCARLIKVGCGILFKSFYKKTTKSLLWE